jgi:hypothetical protein
MVAALLLAIAGGYVLVWVHAEYAHGSALSSEECVVCSWAKSLATIGASAVCMAVVCAVIRIAPLAVAIFRPFFYRLPVSARSPPTDGRTSLRGA